MQMFVYLSLGTQKKKKKHFWVTVVVLLQNEKPVFTLSPFLMGEFLLL